jgi:hypothetical protein
MQHTPWICVIVALLYSLGSPPQTAKECPPGLIAGFSLSTVEGALKVREEHFPLIATYDKLLAQLGDNAAIAILKLVSPKDLLKPSTVDGCLYVIVGAFSNPQVISGDINKDPKVTLFLLGYLYDKENDPELKKHIEQTKEYVENHARRSTQ